MVFATGRINRMEENDQYGTFGALIIGTEAFCATLEPSDQGNKPFVSSIPAQQYTCRRVMSPTFGETFEIMNVPGRDNVLFHPGNTIDDTAGCVILGQYFGKLKDKRSVNNSGKTFEEFMDKMAGIDVFILTIKEVY